MIRVYRAFSQLPDSLKEIEILGEIGMELHDIDYPAVGVKGSLQNLVNLNHVKRLQIPLVFLVGFVRGGKKSIHNLLPRSIESLRLTYDLSEHEGGYPHHEPIIDMPEWEWSDGDVFNFLESWLSVWESCTPYLREIILDVECLWDLPDGSPDEDHIGVWNTVMRQRVDDLSIQTGITIWVFPLPKSGTRGTHG